MRIALIADLHGRPAAWRRIVADVARCGADRLLLLGDYLDALVSERGLDTSPRRAVAEVVDPDEELWRELGAHDLVVGNQEQRIAALLRPDQVPAALAPLLAAPPRRRLEGGGRTGMDVLLEHGHGLRWRRVGELHHPMLDQPFDARVMVVGHWHQNLALAVGWPDGAGGAPRLTPVPFEVGRPLPLRPAGADQMFVTIGPARENPSTWAFLDDEEQTITLREVRG